MDRLRKHYSHLAEGWFLARMAAWALSGCMATDSADHEPACKRAETIFSAQCAVWCNQKCLLTHR